MYRKLLLALFAILFGVTAGMADNVIINVDNAANVNVSYGSDNTPLELTDGMNRITDLTASDSPITIWPANGAEIVSVTKNETDVLNPSGDGAYRVAVEAMKLDIVTSGDVEIPTYNIFFSVTGEIGKFYAEYDEESVLIDESKYYPLPAKPITLRPAAGFQLTEVEYNPMWTGNEAVNNGDGTWTFTPAWDYTMVYATVAEKGINFKVETALASNIAVYAFMDSSMEWDNLSWINLIGYESPYTGVAPLDTYSLGFNSVEGGNISSIVRIQANGEKTTLTKSEWKGWASYVADGDTFIVSAVGPEVEITLDSQTEGMAVDRYVVSVAGEVAPFTAENPVVKAHAGDIVTVAGGRGTAVTNIFPDQCATQLQANGPVASFMATGNGTVYIYGAEVTNMTIDVDNAEAVVVRDQNGLGKVLELSNGVNVMENVANPITIAAAQGFLINSVVLDGEPLKPIADGSYKAAIESGSTLVIKTSVKPAAYPVTIALAGEFEWLNVAVDGDPYTVTAETATLMVEPGSELTFYPVKGYLINSLTTSANVLFAQFNEDDNMWTVTANGPGSIIIEMEKWVAGENGVLIDYSLSTENWVAAVLYDADGNWMGSLKQGLNEVLKGSTVEFSLSEFNDAYFSEVLYNGVAQEISENGKICRVEINEEGTIAVTTETEFFVSLAGFSTSDPVNHAIIGQIYFNEEGQTHYKAKPGETVTIIPAPGAGHKFAGFDEQVTTAAILPLISAEAPYTFTVPEGIDYAVVQGNFIKDEDKPGYVVHTYLAYVDGYEFDNLSASAFVRVETMDGSVETNDLLVAEGDQVKFLCYVETADMQCKHFCLYTSPTTVIPQVYTVNGEHANSEGVIEISAYVTSAAAVEVIASDAYRYDAATSTLYAPEAGTVFTLGGQAVKAVEAGANDLSGLAKGIYVVVTPAGTLKIAK